MKALPKTVRLPGLGIKIKVISRIDMAEKVGKNNDGCWVVEDKSIYIVDDIPLEGQWYILGHELDHAVNDWRHDLHRDGLAVAPVGPGQETVNGGNDH